MTIWIIVVAISASCFVNNLLQTTILPELVCQFKPILQECFLDDHLHYKLKQIGLGCCPFKGGSVVVNSLLIVTPIVGFCNCSLFCCSLLYVHSSFAIILMGERELVALLSLCSWCLMIAVRLFLVVPWVCLQFVIVVSPNHTHLLFWSKT